MSELKREKLYKLLCRAPKPQLHLHLDGSLSFEFIKESIARLNEANKGDTSRDYFFGTGCNPTNPQELRQWLMELKTSSLSSGSPVNKSSNWKWFDFCNQFLQTTEDLRSATYRLVHDLNRNHNVTYIEIRFAPILHTLMGLTEEEVVIATLNGFKQAVSDLALEKVVVSGGLILCALRSYPLAKAYETVELCKKNIDGVVGFDIAGDEGSYPLSLFREVLIAAKTSSVNVTVHAGEWSEKIFPTSLENIQLALELNLDRIGHGLAIRSASQPLIDELKQKNIPVEICLTSNCSNPTKCTGFAEHPLPNVLRQGINTAGLNVDNLLLSGNLTIGAPDPTGECVRALLDCGLSPAELVTVIENGFKSGFVDNIMSADITQSAMKEWREYFVPEVMRILNE